MEGTETKDPQDYFDGLPDKKNHMVSLEMKVPTSDRESRQGAAAYKSFIYSLRTHVTDGCEEEIRGLKTCHFNHHRPYLLVPLTVFDGKKFETSLIIEKASLYVILFKSGNTFYELTRGKQRFRCAKVGSQVKIRYSESACDRNISPRAFIKAVMFLSNDDMTVKNDFQGTQEALDTIYWFISEPARFARIFRLHNSYFCDFENWETVRKKSTADHEITKKWGAVSNAVRLAVKNKTNELKEPTEDDRQGLTEDDKKLIQVLDLNMAVDVALAVLCPPSEEDVVPAVLRTPSGPFDMKRR